LRLYLNPYVAQTCLCLDRYVRATWPAEAAPAYQSFLANSFDEALSGAIKLSRYCADIAGWPKKGLVVDPDGRLGPLASMAVDGGTIEFIPDLVMIGKDEVGAESVRQEPFGFIIVFAPTSHTTVPGPLVRAVLAQTPAPLTVVCVSRPALEFCRAGASELRPDVVVFDESFVRRQVPFGAFTARKELYDHWNQPGTSTFHSTTYQPNTISSLQFLRCLERDDPEFFARVSPELERVARDPAYCKTQFARLYSPALTRAIAAVGWHRADVRAAGHYVTVDSRPIFDGVAGVACSVRGHNPPSYRQEMEELRTVPDGHRAATERLEKLTGLGHLLPAVSGASAVENALRLGLVAQYPRNYVLAFKGGFGGKTLLALAGTANSSYKARLDPLYPHVVYVDPFRDSALEDLEATLDRYPVGLVQLELIQAVGGVRPLPQRVLDYLQANKQRRDYLLFVDEVQTGMYRTGPFIRSRDVGVEPDLLTVGKGTADMMFPFAVTLFSDAVRDRLAARGTDLPDVIRRRYDYEFGYRTLVNVLDRAEEAGLPARVRENGALFRQLLSAGLSSCRAVRDVRGFGLLLAIELDTARWPRKWLKKQAGALYILSMLRHRPFPVLMGFCQYEPHVLKFTPPLSTTSAEVQRICEAVTTVLRRPAHQLLAPLFGTLAKSFVKRKWEAYWEARSGHERVERSL